MIGAHRAVALGSAGSAGGATYFVGSFTKSDSTGTQAVTGVGFTPRALLLWTSGSNAASGTFDPSIVQCIGMTTGAAESYAVGGYSADAAGTSDTSRRIAAKALTVPNTAGSGVTWEADLDSFDADGFTLDWTTNSATAPFGGTVINFIAFDVPDAKVVQWQATSGTGTQAVTGAGFQPSLIVNLSSQLSSALPASATQHYLLMGAYDGSSQFGVGLFSQDNQATSNTSRVQSTSRLALYDNGSGSVVNLIAGQSLDADGFTVDRIQSATTQHITLCLGGIDAKVGTFNPPTSTGNSAVTGVGFEPKALMLADIRHLSMDSVLATNYFSLGGTDGTSARSAGHVDRDNVGTTEADSKWDNDHAISTPTVGPAVGGEATLDSFDADGFTLNWTTVPGGSDFDTFYIAFGDTT